MKFALLVFRNVLRNPMRSLLTALGTMVLVFVVTLVWSVLDFLDAVTTEKADNLKMIVSERWQVPSRLPYAYAHSLTQGAWRNPGDIRPVDSMTWQFYGATVDPQKQSRDSIVFFVAMEPRKLSTMMDDLDSLPDNQAAELQAVIEKLEQNKHATVIGRERLRALNKQVGERVKFYGINYQGLDLEMEIVGTFPEGTRYENTGVFNRDYLNDAFDAYERAHKGKKHPRGDRTLNLVWLRVADRDAFGRIAAQVMSSPEYASPAVKCITSTSSISTVLEAYQDLIWGMRWLLAPSILVTLSLVIANSISISVRERRTEIAVMKVLGYRPRHVVLLVMGEALSIGTLAGGLSAALTYGIINGALGGLKFPIAFFAAVPIPAAALWWGLAVGISTAFLGSLIPALSARKIRVAEVFAKVA